MAFQSFQELLPEIAENETRSITILQNAPGLPPAGHYAFIEIGEHTKAVTAWKIALEYSPTDKMARANLKKFGSSNK